jgi:hypothetical protein
LWITSKYADLAAPIPLASGNEAELIRAEALAETGQVASAMGIVNSRRAAAGLGPLSATTPAAAVAIILDERKVALAFEGGHRLNDILRRNLPWKGGSRLHPGRQSVHGATVRRDDLLALPHEGAKRGVDYSAGAGAVGPAAAPLRPADERKGPILRSALFVLPGGARRK